jgi:hypothetical protein
MAGGGGGGGGGGNNGAAALKELAYELAEEAVMVAIETMHELAGNPGQDVLIDMQSPAVEEIGMAMAAFDQKPDGKTLDAFCEALIGMVHDFVHAFGNTSIIRSVAVDVLLSYWPEIHELNELAAMLQGE